MNPTFIADGHLGKLARALRLLGFDTLYNNACAPAQLLVLAAAEGRVLLSRSRAFATHTTVTSILIQSEEPDAQLLQVVRQFQLQQALHPFSRCLVCNGQLVSVPKADIIALLQESTTAYFNKFRECKTCRRIYWQGSHYDRMLQLVENVKHAAL